jgi:hypothetical protein
MNKWHTRHQNQPISTLWHTRHQTQPISVGRFVIPVDGAPGLDARVSEDNKCTYRFLCCHCDKGRPVHDGVEPPGADVLVRPVDLNKKGITE